MSERGGIYVFVHSWHFFPLLGLIHFACGFVKQKLDVGILSSPDPSTWNLVSSNVLILAPI